MSAPSIFRSVIFSEEQAKEVERALLEHVKFWEESVRLYERRGHEIDGGATMLAHSRRRLLATNNALDLLRAAPRSEGMKS